MANKDYKVTYTEGPRLGFNQPLTKGDYHSICEELSNRFNKTFSNGEEDSYIFQPEPITEGGIVMVQFPGKKDQMYKSIRHHIRTESFANVDWPFIDEKTVMDSWYKNNTIIIPSKTNASTRLKAFYGAPVWTIDELNIIKSVLIKNGIKVTHMPKKNTLSQDANEYT